MSLQVVLVLAELTVLTQSGDSRSQLAVAGDERAGVAEGAEVLRRVEAECAGEARAARTPSVALRAVRLARVFEDGNADRLEPRQVGDLPVEVNGQEEARLRRHGGLGSLGFEAVIPLGHVGEDGTTPRLDDGLERRRKRESGQDDLVT